MTSGADAAAQTTGATVMRSGVWTAISHLLPQLYILAISIAAARFLGPDDFGRQSFIAFVALSVHVVLGEGIALALMRSIAEALGSRRPDIARGLVVWAYRCQVVGAALGGLVLLAAALFGAEPEAAWAFAAAFTAVGILQSVPNAALLGTQRFREAAIIGLVTGAVTVPATIGVLAAGGGIVGIFAVEAALAVANLAWTWVLARRLLHGLAPRVRHSVPMQVAAMRFAGWTTLSALVSLVVWRRSEFFFLAHYSTDAQIGIYSIAFATVTALATLPERLSGVLVSAFATLQGAQALERIRSGFSRALRLVVICTLPLTAGTIAVGPALLRAIYGEEYEGTGPVLIILIAVLPMVAVSSISASLMSGFDEARKPLLVGVFAAIVNLILAFILIPRHDAVGAAIANGGGQVAATFAMFAAARRFSGPVRWEAWSLLRTAVAAVACGAAAHFVLEAVGGGPGVALAVIAGSAVFAALAFGLRVLSRDDAEWLEEHLGARLGPVARRAGA